MKLTDQEEAQYQLPHNQRSAFYSAKADIDQVTDMLHVTTRRDQMLYAAGLAARPEPVLGEGWQVAMSAWSQTNDKIESIQDAWQRVADSVIEAYLSQFPKREGQEVAFDAGDPLFREKFEAALKHGNWPSTRNGDGYRSPMTDMAWRVAFATVNLLKLYTKPKPDNSSAESAPFDKAACRKDCTTPFTCDQHGCAESAPTGELK